jgi:hypothetical protein
MSGDAPVAVENQRPGDADWQLARPALAHEIEGYASATSIDRGEPIELFVHTRADAFALEVFRIGWYRGRGARRVFGPIVRPGRVQPMPTMDPDTGLVDCAWEQPCTLHTGAHWTSGVYLVRLTAQDSGAQSYIPFVLRNDAHRAALLVQLPVTTYQAYNAWGGKSLYHWGSSGGQRAAKVSFNRPYAANPQNPAAGGGVGAGEFLTNLQPHPSTYGVSNAGWDVNWVRWLEREGYDLGYSSNLDTHARPELLRRHRGWLSIGHDEYWSAEMRRHVEAGRDAGVHLGFFGANCAYWQVRFEGPGDRIMVCHKKARRDPLASTDPGRATVQWRLIGRPEQALIGVMYAGDPVDADIVVADAAHWVFDGTGLANGDRLPGLLGYEVDCVHEGVASTAHVLAASPWTTLTDPTRQGVAHMGHYRAASGAHVFATGSIQWPWGLDDSNAPALRPSRLNAAAERITRNVLQRFTAAG